MSESFAVIGGEGFLGHALVTALAAKFPGSTVLSLDLEQRHFPEKQQWSFSKCDLTALESLTSAFEKGSISTVFHTASPWAGSSAAVCEKINVRGTQNIVNACKETNVRKLIFTSSAGVAYNGNDLINVDERCTPPEDTVEAYNDTKARAEAIVLAANGSDLMTCAIRPAGIVGPGDRQNIPGWVEVLKQGKTKFQMGDNKNLFDVTYIDNVVHGHLLAAEKLGTSVPSSVFDARIHPVSKSLPRRKLPTSATAPLSLDESLKNATDLDPPLPARRNRFDQWFEYELEEDTQLPIAGEAFYITNGEAIPFWSWGTSVWHQYNGFDNKMMTLPGFVGMLYAQVAMTIAKALGRPATVTPSSVRYALVSRYYNIEKARRMLGYEPVVSLDEGLKKSMQWYKANEATIKPPQFA